MELKDIIANIKQLPFYQEKNGIIYQADCREILKDMPEECIDLVFTDPPFMISKEVKIYRSRNPKKFYKYKGKDINFYFGDWDVFETEDKYWEFTFDWLDKTWKLLRKGGHLLIFFDKFKITPLVKWIENHSGIARQPLFWIKKNPVPCARKVSFQQSVSLIFWATKYSTSRKYATFNYQLGQHPDYEFAPICQGNERYSFGFHPTQKPLKICEWLIKYLSNENDIVLDPFLGSGTIAVACKKLKRNYIGIEINEEYCKIAKERVKSIPNNLL